MACGLQNGRGQPESVFCVFYTCNGLICSSQSRLCMVFPFCRIQWYNTQKRTKTNKQETQKFHQKRAPTQETKKQRNKTNCTPKTGEDAENWVPSCFLFCLFFWFIVFLVPCFFWRAGRTKKWQDLTFCYFSQLRVCKIVFFLLIAVGLWFHDKTTTKPQKDVGIIVGTLWVWDMDWAILCPIQFWKYAKRLCKT